MNNDEITIRWVTEFDKKIAAGIISLVNLAIHDGGTLGFSNLLEQQESEDLLESMRHRVNAGEAHVLIGTSESTPVMLAVLSLNGMHNCRHRAEISKGIIHPQFRGRRLVMFGLQKIVERAEIFGISQLVLDVRENSRAHALWERMGFSTYGVLDDYARFDGERFRGHFMVQSVASLRARVYGTKATHP